MADRAGGLAWLLALGLVASGRNVMAMELKSQAFEDGGRIPSRYACDGDNFSPPLAWSGVPRNARSLVLIVEDPDAPSGVFDHWLLYDLAPDWNSLDINAGPKQGLPPGALEGKNSYGQLGWGGPCPPSGEHRYIFQLYALDVKLDLKAGASKQDLRQAMQGHVLDQGTLMGRYPKSGSA